MTRAGDHWIAGEKMRDGSPDAQAALARQGRYRSAPVYDQPMADDRLYFTGSDEADALLARGPMALLIGFALDQQVTVQKAFSGRCRRSAR